MPDSLIYSKEVYLIVSNSNFVSLNCSSCKISNVQIVDTYFYFKNINFSSCLGHKGGAIYVTNSSLESLYTSLTTSTSNRVLAETKRKLALNLALITKVNYIQDSTFEKNEAIDSGGAIFLIYA